MDMREFDMILKVFEKIGDSLLIETAYSRLIELNKNDPYAKAKAAGSLGGAMNGGTLVRHGNFYIRVR